MRRVVLVSMAVTAALLVPVAVRAQDNPNVNMDDFVPSVHSYDIINVMGTRIDKGFAPSGGFWAAFRKNALAIEGDASGQLVRDQIVGDFYGAVSLKGWGSVGLDIPVLFSGSGDSAIGIGGADGAALGDLRLSGKVKFWDNRNRGFGVGLGQELTLPTATGDNYFGEDSATSRTSLILDYNRAGWSLAANAGYFARKNVAGYYPPFQDELHLSAGLVVPFICDVLEGVATTSARTTTESPFGGQEMVAMNWLAGLRGRPIDGLVLALAGGGGYGTLPGNPAWQAMANIGFERRQMSCDADSDGLCDRQDKCPGVAGPAETDGCPDRDRDGILDLDDRCPDQAGEARFNGCPDKDGDGLIDRDDQCPDDPGEAATKGCPDRDGDGIVDRRDKCPDEKGAAELGGCPDRDGDGIIDGEDKCPDEKGPQGTGGCPDKDADGIADGRDKCPDQWGTVKYEGCPPPTPKKVQVTREKIVILDKVFFTTGKSTIKQESFGLLRDVASVLKDNDWIKLIRVEGHTDNRGKRDANLKLSQGRADAVKAFLAKEGVAAERLEAVGYGPDKPLVEGKTNAAHDQNRRVEFSIIETAE